MKTRDRDEKKNETALLTIIGGSTQQRGHINATEADC
jgi:hypothetical protein